MAPSPETIRRNQKQHLRATLQAALAVLPVEDDTIVVVPDFRDMTGDIQQKHCKARHPGIRYPSATLHYVEHLSKDFDHVHAHQVPKEES